LLLIGFFCALYGLLQLLTTGLHYPNHWNQPVFAPYTILIGILLIVGSAICWKRTH
jgi:hypothetical protein